jgi:hypothetical protein
MMIGLKLSALVLLVFPSASLSRHLQAFSSQLVNLWRLQSLSTDARVSQQSGIVIQDSSSIAPEDTSGFSVQWFTQPLNHFDNSSETFAQRFWVNTRHYHPHARGPVFVLDGGETGGEDRLPFLNTGIMEILAKATGGISVVLEHRYYGTYIAK